MPYSKIFPRLLALILVKKLLIIANYSHLIILVRYANKLTKDIDINKSLIFCAVISTQITVTVGFVD